MRKALDLSTTTQPRATASGANFSDVLPPAENSARSKPSSASLVSSRTSSCSPAKATRLPAERADANGTTSEAGKLRSSSTFSTSGPTAPVAPTTASFTALGIGAPMAQLDLGLEGGVQRRHRVGHVCRG